jgi:hypothetical protein
MKDEKHILVGAGGEAEPDLPPPLSPEREAELIAGFLSGKPAGELDFVNALRPLLQAAVGWRHPALWRDSEDIQQSAILKVYTLREDREVERIHPPLFHLACYLADAPAQVVKRARKKFVRLRDFHFTGKGRPTRTPRPS